MRLSIIIPAFNEEASVTTLLERVVRAPLPTYAIVRYNAFAGETVLADAAQPIDVREAILTTQG